MIPRTLHPFIARIVSGYGKMAFLSGPRQVGKTTLAKDFARRSGPSRYFNWDSESDKKLLLKDPYFFEHSDREPGKKFLLIYDEIHKYRRWKNYLKGAYDTYAEDFSFLVTGSGRLDIYQKGGDSLMGRYFPLPLLPLTLGELLGRSPSLAEFKAGLGAPPSPDPEAAEYSRALMTLGGFPEPFVRAGSDFHGVWSRERRRALLQEDVRSLVALRESELLETTALLLPERVGAPLSINNLREDVGASFPAVRDWLLLLERFYYLFRIPPFAGSLARALRKERKAYLYDWADIPGEGPRFENLVALHLLKAVSLWNAAGGRGVSLHYVRDTQKREADFLLMEGKSVLCLVECKLSDVEPDPALLYFQRALKAPCAVQLTAKSGVCRKLRRDGRAFWVVSADRWLALLP